MGKLVTTHLTINAPAEAVWETLTDLASYAAWNPFVTAASGDVGVGQRLDLTVKPPGGRATRFRPWVTAVEPHRYLEWLGHLALPGVFDGRHSFTLTPMSRGRTLLQQSETFTGMLTPLTGSLVDRTRAGFVTMNDALARRVSRHAAPPRRAS